MNDCKTIRENQALNARAAGSHKGRDATEEPLLCKEGFGIYIHLPFCRHKCPFCDFFTNPIVSAQEETAYVESVCQEIKSAASFGWKQGREVTSIYIGGGTPSVTPVHELERLLETLRSQFLVPPDIEITIEANPEDVLLETANKWRQIGINRVSLGVQSLAAQELVRLERLYSPDEALNAIRILRDASFQNISVDMMFGLEGQTRDKWENHLTLLLSAGPDHISCYGLTIEEKTVYAAELSKGILHLPPDDTQAELFLATRTFLAKRGFEGYEVSNFAKRGKASPHNLNYWRGGEYWGIGASAHSFQKTKDHYLRWWNTKKRKGYTREIETVSKETHFCERLMTGLRLKEGVSLPQLESEIGIATPQSIQEGLSKLESNRWIEKVNNQYCVSEEKLVVLNEILTYLF